MVEAIAQRKRYHARGSVCGGRDSAWRFRVPALTLYFEVTLSKSLKPLLVSISSLTYNV